MSGKEWLDQYSDEDLKRELERRKIKRRAPKMKKEYNLEPIAHYIRNDMAAIIERDCQCDDSKQYLFETVIECLFEDPDKYHKWLDQYE
jgi:hypothetical protein